MLRNATQTAAVRGVFTRATATPAAAFNQQRRGMATEQQLKTRIKSVVNIEKITKAMKMVAAAKLRSSEAALITARKFIVGIENAWSEEANAVSTTKPLFVAFSSDKGLCGGVHSVVAKALKQQTAALKESEDGEDPGFIVFGDRVKAGLERTYGDYFVETVSESGKSKLISFGQACDLADIALKHQGDFKETIAVFNKFKSAIAYETTMKTVPTLAADTEIEFFDKFEFEGNKSDVMKQYHEFRTACRFYHWSMEAATSEQSARMTAMDNSSKNAKEMLDELELVYNRNRQSRITTELTEIISGASAAEEV